MSSDNLQKRDRIVYVENTVYSVKPFVLSDIDTMESLQEKLYERIPEMNQSPIGIRAFASRFGVMNRIEFKDTIPFMFDTIYIYIYLRKHPRISSKIETKFPS